MHDALLVYLEREKKKKPSSIPFLPQDKHRERHDDVVRREGHSLDLLLRNDDPRILPEPELHHHVHILLPQQADRHPLLPPDPRQRVHLLHQGAAGGAARRNVQERHIVRHCERQTGILRTVHGRERVGADLPQSRDLARQYPAQLAFN